MTWQYNAIYGVCDRKVLQEMCSVLPEDKQGPVLDDIRKISKERRRQRVAAPMSAAASTATALRGRSPTDQLTGVYRSTSELSYAPTPAADEGDGHRASGPRTADAGTLMATVRAARRRQSMSATVVYNPAFYEPPQPVATLPAINPSGQPYLRMTPENGFSLHGGNPVTEPQ